MNEADLTRLHAIIDGQVQGVGFRYFVQKEAEATGVTGWMLAGNAPAFAGGGIGCALIWLS